MSPPSNWHATNSNKGIAQEPNKDTVSSVSTVGGENDGFCGSPAPCGQLTYHGGSVMHNALVVPVFWGGSSTIGCSTGFFDNPTIDPTAVSPNDCTYAGISAAYITDFCASSPSAFFANINQYTDGSGSLGTCANQANLAGFQWWWDLDTFPSNPLSDGQIQSESLGVLNTLNLPANPNTIVVMFTPFGEGSCVSNTDCFPTGDYCAYHSWFWSGIPLLSGQAVYASLPDYGWKGCGIGGPSPNSDPWGDAVVTGVDHETSEAFTDPLPGNACTLGFIGTCDGWYFNDYKHENGDQCNFDFVGTEPDGSNVRLGAPGTIGDPFRIQSEWSNSNGGCTFDLNGSPTQIVDAITPDFSTGTIAQSFGFSILFREAGESAPLEATSFTLKNWPFTSSLTVFVTPLDNFDTLPSVTPSVQACFDVNCSTQVSSIPLASTFLSYNYYELLEEDPFMNVIGGGSPPPVSIDYVTAPSCGSACNGVPDSTQVLSASLPATIFAVLGSTADVPTCVPAGFVKFGIFIVFVCPNTSTLERWDTGYAGGGCNLFFCSTPEAVSSVDSILGINYYHQFLFTDSYFVSGGGSPTAPTFSSTQFGSPFSTSIATTGTSYWLDAGTAWSITNPLVGSSSTERWQTSSPIAGTVTAQTSEALTYYHQFLFTDSYLVIDGGSPTAPTLSSTQFGAAYNTPLTTATAPYWLDNGAAWSVTNPLSGSSSSERWQTMAATSGAVSGATTQVFNYYHQWFVALSFSISDGSTGFTSNPTLTGFLFGVQQSPITLTSTPTSTWLDAVSFTVSPNPLLGSTSTERWFTNTATGTIGGTTLNIIFNHQFFIAFTVTPSGSGSASPTGFYNANSPDSISATAASDWIFSSWTGTKKTITFASSASASTTMTITGSGAVTATFIQNVVLTLSTSSLTISPGGSGSLTATITGAPQKVTLTSSSATHGITASFASKSITDGDPGVTDSVTIAVKSSVAPGTYQITIIATGSDGVVSQVTVTLTVP